MRKIVLSSMLLCFLSIMVLCSDVKNPDKPLKGQWDFKLKKVWERDRAGDAVFSRLASLLVSDYGFIYFRDSQTNKTHIFNTNGKYIKFFASRGEGPGEIKHHMSAYLVGNKFIIADFDRLHYFTKDGGFIKSAKNLFFQRRPAFFIDENEFISAPIKVSFMQSINKGPIKRVNLKTGEDKVISEFQVFEAGDIRHDRSSHRPAKMVIAVGLSPLMTIGQGSGKFYHGISNLYKIYVADMEGKHLFSFSVDRKRQKISREHKKQIFSANRRLEEDEVKQLVKTFPDEITYFYKIEEINGLIFVYVPDPLHAIEGHQNPKQIDIFSPGGKYLYRAHLNIEQSWKPLSTIINKDFLYVILEDEEGDLKLAKYQISLPRRFN
jgi:hypothetical protein